MRSCIILLCLLVTSKFLCAQEVVPNCMNPEIIKVPFVSNNDEIDQIYYQVEDEYTYWYQIMPETDCLLEYKMTNIGEGDDYEFSIYESSSEQFCKDIVINEIQPILQTKSGSLMLKNGSTYFLGVIYLNGIGCGHNLSLKVGENNLSMKAIQNECVEEAIEELMDTIVYVEPKIKLVVAEVDTAVSIEPKLAINEAPLKLDKILKGLVVNNKTNENIEATVMVHKAENTREQQFYSNIDSGFVLKNFLDKEIVVSVKKLGYQLFYDTLNVESGSFKIELIPLAVGEKIIMKKVYFYPNTYALKEESKPELNKLLEFMLENNTYYFEIQGHTSGNKMVKKMKRNAHLGAEWNFKGTSKKLSKLRAEKVKEFLIKNGISENQLRTEGYGGDRMIVAKPKNMVQAMKNIRVEVIVLQ